MLKVAVTSIFVCLTLGCMDEAGTENESKQEAPLPQKQSSPSVEKSNDLGKPIGQQPRELASKMSSSLTSKKALPLKRKPQEKRKPLAKTESAPAPAKEVVKAGVGLEAVSPHKIAKKEKEQPENKWIPDELSDHNDPFQCPDWKDQCAPQTDEDIPVVGFVLMTSGSDDRNGWSIGRFHKKTPAVFWEL